jgi:hypothetical protein
VKWYRSRLGRLSSALSPQCRLRRSATACPDRRIRARSLSRECHRHASIDVEVFAAVAVGRLQTVTRRFAGSVVYLHLYRSVLIGLPPAVAFPVQK